MFAVWCDSISDGLSFPVRTVDEDYDSLLGQRQRWMEENDADTNGTTTSRCFVLIACLEIYDYCYYYKIMDKIKVWE